MPAYHIGLGREIPENWRELLAEYIDRVEVMMAKYGGGYRSYLRHRTEVVEGDFGPFLGPVVLEFPRWDQLWVWYHSEEYAPLKALRQRYNRWDVILIDGLTDEELAENQSLISLGQKGVP